MEFKNKIFVNTIFFVLLLISLFCFIFSIKQNQNDFYIPFYGRLNSIVRVNVEIPKENLKDFEFYSESNMLKPKYAIKDNSYVYFEEKLPTNKLYFRIKDDKVLSSINNIVISLGRNFYYYTNKDIKNFKHENEKYFLPSDIKYTNTSKYINDKGKMYRYSVWFLSVFYNTKHYILPLMLFFIAVLIYVSNKEKFNFNFNFLKDKVIWIIIFISTFLCFANNSLPYWGDELYTVAVASGIERPFIATFQDPGNPPFFFILAKVWMFLFGSNEEVCRFLTSIFSISSVYLLYLFIKRNLGKENVALLASFLLAIDVFLIRYANDFRAYSLMIFLSLLSAYFLFEIINYKKNKDFIIYAVVASLMANTHYFQILFLTGNFILGECALDKKNKVKFLISNLIAVLSFLPYFIMTGLNQGLLDKNFNVMPLYEISSLWHILSLYCKISTIVGIIFFAAILICILKIRKQIFEKDDKFFNLYIYSAYSVFMLFVTSYIFSCLVKPIIRYHYCIEILPFLYIMIAGLIFAPFKNKILSFLVSLSLVLTSVFTSFNLKNFTIDLNIVIRMEEMLKYQLYDSIQYRKKNKKIEVAIFDFSDEYAEFYKKYLNKDDTMIYPHLYGELHRLSLENFIKSGADVFYLLMPFHSPEYLEKGKSEKYNISGIVTDDNIFCMRAVRK